MLHLRFILGLISLGLGVSIAVDGQSDRVDSLRRIVKQNTKGSETIKALIALGTEYEKSDPKQAVGYFRQAVFFTPSRGSEEHVCKAANMLGVLYHRQSKYDSSFYFHRKALAIAEQFRIQTEMAHAFQGFGENFLRQSKVDSALACFRRALEISLTVGEPSLEAGIYNNLGNVYLDQGNYTDALTQFIRSAKLYDSATHNLIGMSKAYSNIGNIETILGHLDKALDYAQRSLDLSIQNNDQPNIAYCNRLLGRIYRKQGNPNKALGEYQKAILIYDRQGDRRNSGETHYNMGNIYYDLRQYHEALAHYAIALATSRSTSNPSQMAYTFSGIGYSWYALKDFQKSIQYFDSSLTYARTTGNRYLVMDAYEVLSDVSAQRGKFREALEFHKSFSSLRDSIHMTENQTAAEELEVRYQNSKKQSEIDLLQKDQQLKTTTLREQRVTQTALAIAIALILVIGLLLFHQYRILQESRRRREVERVRNQLARDLHDDIGSALSSINIISQIAIRESGPAAGLFQRIADQSAKMMENMSDMVWSINPGNDALDKVVVRMKEFAAEILEPKNIAYHFADEKLIQGVVLDVEKRKNLFLIYKEALNNAAKYSEGTTIEVALKLDANLLEMSIQDNGRGFELTATKGNGLRNMQQRATEMRGTLIVRAVPTGGTRVVLRFPLT